MKQGNLPREISELQAHIFADIKELQRTMNIRKSLVAAVMAELEDSVNEISTKVDGTIEKMRRYIEEDDNNGESCS